MPSLGKVLATAIPSSLLAGGAGGFYLGSKLKEKKLKKREEESRRELAKAKEEVELAGKLRDISAGRARRSTAENVYLRNALKRLVAARRKELEGS